MKCRSGFCVVGDADPERRMPPANLLERRANRAEARLDAAVARSQTFSPAPPPTVAALPMIDNPAPMPSAVAFKKPVTGTLTGREGK